MTLDPRTLLDDHDRSHRSIGFNQGFVMATLLWLCIFIIAFWFLVSAAHASSCPPSSAMQEAYVRCSVHLSKDFTYPPPFDEMCPKIRDALAACYVPPDARPDDLSVIQKALK